MIKVKVKSVSDDRFGRRRVQNIEDKKYYVDTGLGNNDLKNGHWHTTSKDGEPEAPLRDDIILVIEYQQITGQKLSKIRTLKSMYDSDSILLFDDKGDVFRLKVEEIFKFNKPFNEMIFNIIPKVKHNYLEVVQ